MVYFEQALCYVLDMLCGRYYLWC